MMTIDDALIGKIVNELEASAVLNTTVLTWYEQGKISNERPTKETKQDLLDDFRRRASACRALVGQLKQDNRAS